CVVLQDRDAAGGGVGQRPRGAADQQHAGRAVDVVEADLALVGHRSAGGIHGDRRAGGRWLDRAGGVDGEAVRLARGGGRGGDRRGERSCDGGLGAGGGGIGDRQRGGRDEQSL